MQKFHNFAGSKFDLWIKWITRKMKTLFKLEDKSLHPACKRFIPQRLLFQRNNYRRNSEEWGSEMETR